jgi:hypothetical protein
MIFSDTILKINYLCYTSWCSGRLIGSPRQRSRVQDPISTIIIHEGSHWISEPYTNSFNGSFKKKLKIKLLFLCSIKNIILSNYIQVGGIYETLTARKIPSTLFFWLFFQDNIRVSKPKNEFSSQIPDTFQRTIKG